MTGLPVGDGSARGGAPQAGPPPRALRGNVRPGDPLAADATARWNRAMGPLAAHREVLDEMQGQAMVGLNG